MSTPHNYTEKRLAAARIALRLLQDGMSEELIPAQLANEGYLSCRGKRPYTLSSVKHLLSLGRSLRKGRATRKVRPLKDDTLRQDARAGEDDTVLELAATIVTADRPASVRLSLLRRLLGVTA